MEVLLDDEALSFLDLQGVVGEEYALALAIVLRLQDVDLPLLVLLHNLVMIHRQQPRLRIKAIILLITYHT